MIYRWIFIVVVGGWCAFMILGGGFFWTEALAGNITKTNTYTLYPKLPPPPQGPRFCSHIVFAPYGIVLPCNYEPPFVWWLLRKTS